MPRDLRRIALVHGVLALVFFWPALFSRHNLYFRDISYTYYPNFVFLERALGQGVWPLWNPSSDAGAPFLDAYPVDIALVWLLGARAALHWGAALHLWLALFGASVLARRLGQGGVASLVAGLAYGLSGYVLSSASLLQLFQSAAWAPVTLAALVGLARAPSRRGIAACACAIALQASTLGGEILALTLLAAPFLIDAPPRPRALAAAAAACGLATLAAAPVLFGLGDLMADSGRGSGFDRHSALAFSTSAPVLAETLLPRLFGDVHAFTDAGSWGREYFPGGAPYLPSLYLGAAVAGLALAGSRAQLVALALLGTWLSMGAVSPLGLLPGNGAFWFRSPVKLMFLPTLAVALMAGHGIAAATRLRRALAAVPALCLLGTATALLLAPDLPASFVGGSLASASARELTLAWPAGFLRSGALALLAALAVASGRLRAIAPLAVGLDLTLVNLGINPSAPPDFYDLRPEIGALLQPVRAAAPTRVLAFGLAQSAGVLWSPATAERATDVQLYGLDRQALLPRSQVLDGLEAALDEDRTGFAPRDATVPPNLRRAGLLPLWRERARRAGVGFVLSFDPVPAEAGLREVASARVPGVLTPLRLYELPDRLPRAFGVPLRPGEPSPAVEWSRIDPHRVELHVTGPPGAVVVLEGYSPAWRAVGRGAPIPIEREPERYWRLPFGGGEERIRVQYQPVWRGPALAASLAAGAALIALSLTPRKASR